MKHVFLIGFMGSGKTTVGKQLSALLGWPLADTDQRIEARTGESIPQIFETKGEPYFRDLETEELKLLKEAQEEMVISAGGGLPMREPNQALLKELGTVVYLTATTQTLIHRLSGSKSRPKLNGGDLKERIEALMAQRGETYQALADLTIVTDGKSPAQIAEEIYDLKKAWKYDTIN